jgi:hypothetical protein
VDIGDVKIAVDDKREGVQRPDLVRATLGGGDDGRRLADGFLRLANSLPLEWLLQLITQSADRITVEQLAAGAEGRGRQVVSLGPGEMATLVISGLTRDTAEAAGYEIRVSRSTG